MEKTIQKHLNRMMEGKPKSKGKTDQSKYLSNRIKKENQAKK